MSDSEEEPAPKASTDLARSKVACVPALEAFIVTLLSALAPASRGKF